jgi:hypothetical protein
MTYFTNYNILFTDKRGAKQGEAAHDNYGD